MHMFRFLVGSVFSIALSVLASLMGRSALGYTLAVTVMLFIPPLVVPLTGWLAIGASTGLAGAYIVSVGGWALWLLWCSSTSEAPLK